MGAAATLTAVLASTDTDGNVYVGDEFNYTITITNETQAEDSPSDDYTSKIAANITANMVLPDHLDVILGEVTGATTTFTDGTRTLHFTGIVNINPNNGTTQVIIPVTVVAEAQSAIA